MRYFKILHPETGEITAVGKNDSLGVEITEEEYNAIHAEYAALRAERFPPSDEATIEDYQAALAELGVSVDD